MVEKLKNIKANLKTSNTTEFGQIDAKISDLENTAFIALIPKTENSSGFDDFRPISMVGCIYKMVAKILACRLQKVIDSLIGAQQSAFIQGRQILDGAFIASI